jgi:hypothetical protein
MILPQKRFYGLIDQLVDSGEYRQVLGKIRFLIDVILHSAGFAMRQLRDAKLASVERESPISGKLKNKIFLKSAAKSLPL